MPKPARRTKPPSGSSGPKFPQYRDWTKHPPLGAPPGTWADVEAADRVVEYFCRYLKHVKGEWAGQPLIPDEWEAERLLCPAFGWKKADGLRLIRTVLLFVARKNGKSTIAGGVGNYLVSADGEPGAEVYSAAGDRDQAAIVFDTAKGMVESSDDLRSRAEVFRRSISFPATNSVYRVLSADAYTKHGLNAHGIIFDELHTQPNRDLYDVLCTSVGARRQPMIWLITTAGFDRNSICYEVYDYAQRVQAGTLIDPTFLPVIYEVGEKEDWLSEENWYKANPGLGKSVKLDYLRTEAKKAKEVPAYQNTFRRLHLNQWTQQATRWLDMSLWKRNGELEPVRAEQLLGRLCYGGLDLASTTDLAAELLLFPPEDGEGIWDVLCRFWMPEDNLQERVRRDKVPYDAWLRDGLLTATEGNIIDYDVIRNQINTDAMNYNLKEMAYDRWNATQLVTQLTGDGVVMVPFGMGFASMAAPSKELVKLLQGEMLRHMNHPILMWMAENISVRQDPAGNIKPDRSTSGGRIDGIMALLMALGRTMVGDNQKSVYETRGLEVLE